MLTPQTIVLSFSNDPEHLRERESAIRKGSGSGLLWTEPMKRQREIRKHADHHEYQDCPLYEFKSPLFICTETCLSNTWQR
jgi:hypothetical protein